MTNRKPFSTETPGFKEQIRIGKSIADRLPKLATQSECAEQLGISRQMVDKLECRALYKIAMRMKEILEHAEADENEPYTNLAVPTARPLSDFDVEFRAEERFSLTRHE